MRSANHRRIAPLSPKIRWKTGSIVSRSRRVSLTSKTIKGSAAMFADSYVLRGAWNSCLSAPVLEPQAVSSLFGAIAADRHAAPPSRPSSRMVGEDQRAAMSLAGFDVGKVFFAHKPRQRFADRQQQGFGRSPAPHRSQFKTIVITLAMTRYLAEGLVTFEKLVQRPQFPERLGRERPAHMFADKTSEPLA